MTPEHATTEHGNYKKMLNCIEIPSPCFVLDEAKFRANPALIRSVGEQVGDLIIFEDMMHHTVFKTTMFNSVTHPSIGIWTTDNAFKLIREFGYEDYKRRLS
jgi:diaminopimelate decarboxylase